jgi:RNA-directed DNA polymerase
METKLEEIAAKARAETSFQFTSLCHHVTKERVWGCLKHISTQSAPGIDGIGVNEAKESFENWIDPMLQSVHRKGYKAPPVRRVWIPKPGKTDKRPLGVPNIADRALQRSVSEVLSAIYEEDFLPCSFGGRAKLSAHHALSTLNEVISGKKVGWVLEADLENFFGSLDHGWLLQFVKHRVGDPRILNLIERWLRAGVMEDNKVQVSTTGSPQGSSVSVLLSNIYLHYVLDLWFEKVVKPKLRGEVYLVRYIDDFVVCFQYRSDATRFQKVLTKRLNKFSLRLEPNKTRLVEFGRYAQRGAKEWNRKLETIYFLGFTHFCTRNRKGNFMVGRKTEKSRLKRSLKKLCELMSGIRHYQIKEQVNMVNQVLRGHYAYYGLGGNHRTLWAVYRFSERYWYKMLKSRCRKSNMTWEKFNRLKEYYPLQLPKVKLSFYKMKEMAVL